MPIQRRIPQIVAAPVSRVQFGRQRVIPAIDPRGGAVLQQGAEQVASLARTIAIQQAEEQATTRAREADVAAAKAVREIEDTYFAMQRQDAVNARGQIHQDLEAVGERIAKTLPGQRSGDLFRASWSDRLLSAQGRIERHYHQQDIGHRADTLQASADSSRIDAARTVGTDEYEVNRSVMLRDLNALADLQGLPEDSPRRRLQILEATNKLHSDVIDRLVQEGRSDDAATWLEQNRDEVLPNRATDLQDRVKRGQNAEAGDRVRTVAARVADVLGQDFAKTDSTGVAVIDRAGALARLQQEFAAERMSVDVRDEIEKRIERRFKLQSEDRDRAVNQAVATAEAALAANPRLDPNDLPTPTLAVLVEHGKLPDLTLFSNSKRYVDRGDALTEIAQLRDSGGLRQIGAEEFERRFRTRLARDTFQRWDSERAEQRSEGKSPQLQSLLAAVDGVLVEAGLFPVKDRDADETQLVWRERFRQAVQDQIDLKGISDPAKVKELARNLASDRVWETSGKDEEVPAAFLSDQELQESYIKTSDGRTRYLKGVQELDPVLHQMVTSELRRRGLPDNDRSRLEVYATSIAPQIDAQEWLQSIPIEEARAAEARLKADGANHRDARLLQRSIQQERVKKAQESYFANNPFLTGSGV